MNVSVLSCDLVVEKFVSLCNEGSLKFNLLKEVGILEKEEASFEEAVHWVSCKGKPVIVEKNGEFHRFIPGAPPSHPEDQGKLVRVWYRTESHSEIL